MSDLDEQLAAIQLILARRIRERLESDEGVPPAFLDVARRFLLDSLPKARAIPHTPPLVTDLPFPDEVE